MSSNDADLRFVRDRMEISNLLHSYAHHADNRDHAALLALFREDARVQIGPAAETSKAEFGAGVATNAPEPGQSRHVLANLKFDAQSESLATGAVYLVFTRTHEAKTRLLMTGKYNFTVARDASGWGIQRWQAVLDG